MFTSLYDEEEERASGWVSETDWNWECDRFGWDMAVISSLQDAHFASFLLSNFHSFHWFTEFVCPQTVGQSKERNDGRTGQRTDGCLYWLINHVSTPRNQHIASKNAIKWAVTVAFGSVYCCWRDENNQLSAVSARSGPVLFGRMRVFEFD